MAQQADPRVNGRDLTHLPKGVWLLNCPESVVGLDGSDLADMANAGRSA